MTDQKTVFGDADLGFVLSHSVDDGVCSSVSSDRSEEAWNSQANVVLEVLAYDERVNMHEGGLDDSVELCDSQLFDDGLIKALDSELGHAKRQLLGKSTDSGH